ncbi:MAG: CotH kinase family protein [Lachnospiraceae bacterium]|nr:CotH kinase family protein [Lachnospiraceae bacterium]
MMQQKRNAVVMGFAVLLSILFMVIYFLCRNQTMGYQVPEAEIQQTGIEKIYLTSRQLNTLSTDSVSYIIMESEKAEGQRDFTNAYIAIQGGTSTVYPKKNYKIKLPEESDYSIYLKANYTDATLLRGSVMASLWADMVATEGISDITFVPNGGSILGTPVLLYKNGQYNGIYFKTKSKSVENYCGIKKPIAVVFCKKYLVEEDYNDDIDFYALDSLWKNVYCQEGMEEAIEDSISSLFQTAKQASDEEFITKMGEHINLDTAIDYLLFLLFFQADDNYTKNIIWVTYDGIKWYPTAYDFDSTFGLSWDGTELLPLIYNLPSFDEKGNPVSSLSLLWNRLLENNFEAVADRYQILRKDVLDENNILDCFYDV